MDKDLRTEIDEAIEAADRALEHLYRARDLLHSARNWGAFDILAGGFISSLIKRGKMSDAQDELDAARSALATFAYELRDIDGSQGVNIQTGNLVLAADLFLDNPFVDMYVQGKIDDARYQVNRAIEQVEKVRRQLAG
ncbi:hypothetical protein [Collinsella tanakaei]|uniref:hypothetical protein n=1 Tax=Collinsella tanakaei TaxID=626935 RepID=UPI001F3263E2|nr:hypothetical protein [Collinsella tanakaei]MCF2621679.1 hypothetical protein [Collinsella tanakaei]MDM8301888.1 hypothetical protein [Collinsella tanakaei]